MQPSKLCSLIPHHTQGITRAFSLNGLHHASRLLKQHTAGSSVPSLANGAPPAADGADPVPPLDPEAFDYLHYYNPREGRHEGYFVAIRDTRVLLPPAHASAAALHPAQSPPAAAAASPQLPAAAAASPQLPAAVLGDAGVDARLQAEASFVSIAAGELIRFELSHKYSEEEVQQLAAAAGLDRVGRWTDSMDLYDLHLFAAAGGMGREGEEEGEEGGGEVEAGEEGGEEEGKEGGEEEEAGEEGGEEGGRCLDGRRGGMMYDAACSGSGDDGGGSEGSPAPTWRQWEELWSLWDAATIQVIWGDLT